MDKLLIRGGRPLHGEMTMNGAKNAVLPIIVASLLSDTPVRITRVPHLQDVTTIIELLAGMGVQFIVDERLNLCIDSSRIHSFLAPYELVKTMRASFLVLGPLLARYQQAQVSLPGGCAIGSRPVNLHIEGLKAMGAEIHIAQGYIHASVKGRLKGAEIYMPHVSVGATENLLMAATLAEGKTVLHQAACEPEIVDLANFLISLGAQIEGVGTSELIIHGVNALKSYNNYPVISDRIEAGTYLIAAAITSGQIVLRQIDPTIMQSVLDVLAMTGANIHTTANSIELDMRHRRPKAVSVQTAPYPGFPTDMQAQLLALNAVAEGRSEIAETIFENRFMHVQELVRLGANIEVHNGTAVCNGVDKLIGAPVMATDLRASASLVLAGMRAEGETLVDRIYHIDRGYERIEEKLMSLGASIKRVGSHFKREFESEAA